MRHATRFFSVLLALLLAPLLIAGCDFIFGGEDGGGDEIALTNHSISPSFVDIQMPGVEAFMEALTDTSSVAPPPEQLPALTSDAPTRRPVTTASF